MRDIENKIRERFGLDCLIVEMLDNGRKALLSDGEYEYIISTNREIYAKSLSYECMTYESRKKYWQTKFPENIRLIDIFKEGKKDPEILFFDINTNGTYLLPFKYEMNYFLSYYENYLKFKIFRETITENILKKYGDEYVVLCTDKNNGNNVIISDGNYEWSVTTSPFRKTGLIQKSLTKNSLIKYHNGRFPEHLQVIDIIERGSGYKVFRIIDKRINKEFDFNYELRISRIVSIIETSFNHNKIYIQKCIKKYGTRFSYDKTEYIDCLHDVIITCPIHGDITINSAAFLYYNKYGCNLCGESKVGFKRSNFILACSGGIGTLYVIEMYNENERFIKIGITSKTVERRFRSKETPYIFSTIAEFKGNPILVWDKEKEFHRHFGKNKYAPLLKFGGSLTECFDISIKQKAISLIEELLVSL